MMKVSAGNVVAIPVGGTIGLGKILFVSKYFKDVTLLKLLSTRFPSVDAALTADLQGPYELLYTGVGPIRKGCWTIIANEPVSDHERAMSKRTAGGEVWLEDEHLGPASGADLASLPRMLVLGSGLVEKRVRCPPGASLEAR